MTARIQVLVASAYLLLAGCAYNQSIDLARGEVPTSQTSISIEDRRSEPDRKTRLNLDKRCSRWYGDTFIAPNKPDYLKHLLGSRAPAEPALNVVLDRFDTVEYCGQTAQRAAAVAQAAAVGGITGTTTYYDVPNVPGGDVFVLRVVGSINGRPFDISKGFDYGDVSFVNFPSESPVYRQRVAEAFNYTADALLALASARQ